jgi:hypothetical protein
MGTDFMESDLTKLNTLYQRGGESFAQHESALKDLLGVSHTSQARGGGN